MKFENKTEDHFLNQKVHFDVEISVFIVMMQLL